MHDCADVQWWWSGVNGGGDVECFLAKVAMATRVQSYGKQCSLLSRFHITYDLQWYLVQVGEKGGGGGGGLERESGRKGEI